MKHRLITAPIFFSKEAPIINELFERGLPCLHFRKPDANLDECARFLEQINPAFYSKIITHQHFELLDSFNLLGVHLREAVRQELSDNELDVLIQKHHEKGQKIGSSIHQKSEIATLPQALDYTFISPVFPSISKQGYLPTENLDINGIKTPFSIVGLGGMDENTLLPAQKLGFGEVAFLGAVWGDFTNILNNYNKICNKINTIDLMF